ncbi:hypothetical protein GCM10022393_06690 [Aquimarina addita]|uniref:Uncharacterized protein n=1 Tax=Aquimarina addita TaxID=870485 RepID=A0ABP7XC88_9FLAO
MSKILKKLLKKTTPIRPKFQNNTSTMDTLPFTIKRIEKGIKKKAYTKLKNENSVLPKAKNIIFFLLIGKINNGFMLIIGIF